MPLHTPEQQWNAYLSAFATARPDEREKLLQQSVADDVEFANPGGNGKGRSVLSAHIAHFREKMPGMYFATDKTYLNQDELLAVWAMHKADGTQVAKGYNFVRLDAAGRFVYMAGFF